MPDPGTTLEAGGVTWRTTSAGVEILRRLGDVRFETAETLEGFELLKRKPDRFWGRLRLPAGTVFMKARKIGQLRRRLRTLFRPSAMREEWCKSWWLRSKGIATPEPLCVGEVRHHGMVCENFFISRWIEDARPLRTFLEESAVKLPPEQFQSLRSLVVKSLGHLLGTLHAAGAYHWEFHDMNILVVGSPESPQFQPIDLDHLVIPNVFNESDRDWNFHQLRWYLRKPIERWGLSPRDVVRFLRAYHSADPRCARDWRALHRRLDNHLAAEPLLERPHRRQFRPA